MQDTNIPSHDYLHLVKTTYSLADALACTHEMEEIYILTKDMTVEEWIKAVHQLLAEIDLQITNECGIPVFQLGLHSRVNMPIMNLKSEYSLVLIPKVIHEAVDQFGSAFCQVVKEIQKRHPGELDRPPTEGEQPDEASLEITDLCKQLVNLILNELGLKSTDLASLY